MPRYRQRDRQFGAALLQRRSPELAGFGISRSTDNKRQGPHLRARALLGFAYAAFFCCALTRAHRALCAAAILRRAAADKVRFVVTMPLDFPALLVSDCVRTFAHRAL